MDADTRRSGIGAEPESYGRLIAQLLGGVAGLIALGIVVASSARPEPKPQTPIVSLTRSVPKPVTAPPMVAMPKRPEPPKLDRGAVASAEADLDAVARERARAEARADEAAKRLADASTQAAADARSSRTLASRVRDPGPRIAQAAARGGFLKGERDKLKTELATLSRAPRPKAKDLSNKNPVARPSDGEEFHFEIRRDRVSYVDLDRLIALVKADAQLRIRLSDGARSVDNQVGPVGAFSLRYVMGRALPAGFNDLVERRSISYDLRGWEVVPQYDGRGETYEATLRPISDFARVVNRINPARSTVTMWVYPDGFPLFRKLRDDLHSRGYTVAARPLPDGMTIRGSPSGSLSAGQ